MDLTKEIITHYDMLVDEENDPVRDPQPLQEYMDKWDGEDFISQMELNSEKSVLELGVGTGRLAVRVAPRCGRFVGIDISPKTVERAKENLAGVSNHSIICADFMELQMKPVFDVVYSSLTFMHICDKQKAVLQVSRFLTAGGRFVLSIDKNQSDFIDMGTRKIKIYPDREDEIEACIKLAGLQLVLKFETEFAIIFVSEKE